MNVKNKTSEYHDVFRAADDMNFDEIKAIITNGEASINALNNDHEPILAVFLYSYYCYLLRSVECAEGFHKEPKDLNLPLDQRSYDIKSIIDWFIENGANLNTPSAEIGDTSKVLFEAVQVTDYYLAEYLLSLGADPNGCYGIPYKNDVGNYFLEHTDPILRNLPLDSKENEMLPRMRALLLKYGATEYIKLQPGSRLPV